MRRKIKKIRSNYFKKRVDLLKRLEKLVIIDEFWSSCSDELKEHLAYVKSYNKPRVVTQSLEQLRGINNV